MARKLVITYVFVICLIICAGQPSQIPNDCVINCVTKADLLLASPSSPTFFAPLGLQQVQIGNMTSVCPAPFDQSDSLQFENACGSVKDVTNCLDSCLDPSSVAFKPLKLMCVDNLRDLEKYLPCLSQSCESVQRKCGPKCGSIDRLTTNLKEITSTNGDGRRRRRNFVPGPRTTPAPIFTTYSIASLDEMVGILAELCTAVDCHLRCAKKPTTVNCGKEAFAMSEHLLPTVFFTAVNQMITTIVSHQRASLEMPAQCKALVIGESNPTSPNIAYSSTSSSSVGPLNVTTPSAYSATSSSPTIYPHQRNNQTRRISPENETLSTSKGTTVAVPLLSALSVLFLCVCLCWCAILYLLRQFQH